MSNPIRMCIVCKIRIVQKKLNRFQCKENTIISFSGQGRSFYVCPSCSSGDKINRVINKMFRRGKEVVDTSYLKEQMNGKC